MKKREALKILGIDNKFDNIKLDNAYKRELLEVRPYEYYSFEKDKELNKQLNYNYSILKKLSLDVAVDDSDYKKNILHELKILINSLNLKKEYINDNLLGETYNKFFNEEFNLLSNTEYLVINSNNNIKIKSIIENSILSHNKLISDFILKIFKKFYNEYHLSTNAYWLKHECINYIENVSTINPNTINSCAKYFFESRKNIFKEIVEKNVDSLLRKLPNNIQEEIKKPLIQKLLSRFTYDQLIKNYYLISNVVDEYVKEKKQKYFLDKLIISVKKKTKKIISFTKN